MSTEHGGLQSVRSTRNGAPRVLIRLAPGIHLHGGEESGAMLVLACPEGNVQLNQIAAAILRLCDGSRNRAEIVAEVVSSTRNQTRSTEIIEFLDAAVARGWIHEA